MPLLAANLSTALFDEIKRLVESGRYVSPGQFLETAAFNQLALEQGELRGDGAGRVTGHPRRRSQRRKRVRGGRPVAQTTRGPLLSSVEVGQVLVKLRLPDNSLPQALAATPRDPAEKVWGQVNRFFPLKVVTRLLARSAAEHQGWPQLTSLTGPLAETAALLGSGLEQVDVAQDRKRDALATSLPRRPNPQSHERFLSHYVARTTRSGGIFPGAICHYALAAFEQDRLCLTDRGVAFAEIPNPILDSDDFGTARSTLAQDERDFLLDHLVRFVPGEVADMRTVLGAIRPGGIAPEEVYAAARKQFPGDWTDVVVRTHLAGLVARLTELGLVARRWEGRNVFYSLNASKAVPLLDDIGAAADA